MKVDPSKIKEALRIIERKKVLKAENVVFKIPKRVSPGEEAFAVHLKQANIKFLREYQAAPPRKWKVDFYFDTNVCVEIEGGTWAKSRHGYGEGFEDDCEKYNCLTKLGYKIYRFTTRQAEDGVALAWLLENKVLTCGK